MKTSDYKASPCWTRLTHHRDLLSLDADVGSSEVAQSADGGHAGGIHQVSVVIQRVDVYSDLPHLNHGHTQYKALSSCFIGPVLGLGSNILTALPGQVVCDWVQLDLLSSLQNKSQGLIVKGTHTKHTKSHVVEDKALKSQRVQRQSVSVGVLQAGFRCVLVINQLFDSGVLTQSDI